MASLNQFDSSHVDYTILLLSVAEDNLSLKFLPRKSSLFVIFMNGLNVKIVTSGQIPTSNNIIQNRFFPVIFIAAIFLDSQLLS